MELEDLRLFRNNLNRGFVSFTFRKADGSIRKAIGTTNIAYIGSHTFHDNEVEETVNNHRDFTKRHGENQIPFFDVEKNAWRSFNMERLESILEVEHIS